MEAAIVKLGEKLSVIWLEEFSPPQIELNPNWGWLGLICGVGLALSANLPKFQCYNTQFESEYSTWTLDWDLRMLLMTLCIPRTRSSLQDSFLMIMFRSFKNLSNHIYTLGIIVLQLVRRDELFMNSLWENI